VSTRTGTGRVYGGRSAAGRDADRRGRLLAAGLEAFGTRGYQHTTTEQLCSAAGVATRSFYESFASREALLVALHDSINAQALDAVAAALASVDADDIPARAVSGFTAYLDVITTDARWVRITLRETVGASEATYRDRQWPHRAGGVAPGAGGPAPCAEPARRSTASARRAPVDSQRSLAGCSGERTLLDLASPHIT
jgi:AcrR family transcriptional regulator